MHTMHNRRQALTVTRIGAFMSHSRVADGWVVVAEAAQKLGFPAGK